MFETLAGLPAFLAYFCVSVVVAVGYLAIYTRMTPHDEFELIRKNVPGAAVSLGLSLVGFALPLAALVGIDRGLRRLGRRVLLTEAWQARLLWAGLAALIAFGILRNLPLAALASLRA